jgi:nitroreductase/FMN reductase [NAD(P)H]
MPDDIQSLKTALSARFGEPFDIDENLSGLAGLGSIAGHRVHRRYTGRDVSPELMRLLCACALSAPSKSDLQQADILILRDKANRQKIADLMPAMPWIIDAPVFLVFLANGRRLPMIAEARGKPFPNDHLDLFFNASVDAALVLATFLRAAEAAGLGCCPISVIRDHAAAVSEMLALPDKVIPIAGMCVGWPAEPGGITPRLPLGLTVHEERFDDSDMMAQIDGYDRRRDGVRPYRNHREPKRFGRADFYGWSEDKARQYAKPARVDFGTFVRAKGFCLD